MKKRLSLNKKLIVYFGSIFIVGLLISNMVSLALCRKFIADKTNESLLELAGDSADKLNLILEDKKSSMEIISQMPYLISDETDLNDKLALLKKLNESIGLNDIAYVDLQGDSYGANGTVRNIADSENYINALKGEVIFSDIIYLEEESFFCISAPLKDEDGNIKGVLMGVQLVDFFDDILGGLSNDFFVLDNNGVIISHSDKEILNNQMPMEEMPKHENFNEVYAVYQNMLAGRTDSILCKQPESGKYNFLSYAPVINGWSIALISDKTEVMSPALRFVWIMCIACGIVILIGLWLVNVASSRLTVKMNEITSYLNRVASGDFEKPIPERLLIMEDEVGDVMRAVGKVKSEIEEMLLTVKDCTDYVNDQMSDFTEDIKIALKESIVSSNMTKEEVGEVLMKIDELNQMALRLYKTGQKKHEEHEDNKSGR